MAELEREVSGHVVTLTLSRRERRNALSLALIESLIAACDALRDDTHARVVVLRASGRDFSLGIDLTDPALAAIARLPLGERRRAVLYGRRVVQAIQGLPQTTIVAMHGYCLGGGACLALACDLRVAASDLKLGMPEVLRGLNMSWGVVPLLVAQLGPARTKELLLTGAPLSAERALAWGLANHCVEGSEADVARAAHTWASEIADGVPPIAASMIKDTINAIANAQSAAVHMDADQLLLAQHSADYAEAVTAFLAKRKPDLTGQ
jgi:enoyl-CoA hydratase